MTTPTHEAIEAAARAMYPLAFKDNSGDWIKAAESGRKRVREDARNKAATALTAAAPIIAAQAKAEALREAAEVYGAGEWVDGFMSVRDDVSAVQAIVAWLNDRAATIEGKSE